MKSCKKSMFTRSIIMSKSWRDKANKLIAEDCMAAYLKANTRKNGKRYKRHHPYSVSELADRLITCLDNQDQVAAEAEAKRIFLDLAVYGRA